MNLYEVLEVSEKASKEIIDKAYRTLAKKYHPDLQTPENKTQAENKMKMINEAYSVLSDDNQRSKYDEKLRIQRDELKRQEIQRQINEQQKMYNRQNNVQNDAQNNKQSNITYEVFKNEPKQSMNYREKIENYVRYAKQPNDVEYNESNRFMDMIRPTLRKIKEWVFTILIMLVIIFIIWKIPFTHNMLVEVYEENPIIKGLVDAIISLF